MTGFEEPVIIEVAMNGGTPKDRNPHVPRTPAEIAADGLRCLVAGAALLHNHGDDPLFGGEGRVDPRPYLEAWRTLLAERPDAIIYPTMPGGGPHTTIERRYEHVVALAEAGLLRMGLCDPGSVSLGGVDPDGLPMAVDLVYQNTYADARYMFETCERLGAGVSVSIFEPGFLRVVLAYHRSGRLPPGVIVKFYFGGEGLGVGFGLPPTEPSLDAYLAMMEGTGLPWMVSVIGGDVCRSGMARLALERGGHVQVGLEPFHGERTPTNEELVGEVAALASDVGRPLATPADAALVIGLPAQGMSQGRR